MADSSCTELAHMQDDAQPELNQDCYRVLGLPDTSERVPLFSISFYNNSLSAELRILLEAGIRQILEQRSKKIDEKTFKPQKSAIQLKAFGHGGEKCENAIMECLHYFDGYHIDRIGTWVPTSTSEHSSWTRQPKVDVATSTLLTEVSDGAGSLPKVKAQKLCFNCQSSEHELGACPLPKNFALINQSRQAFINAGSGSSSSGPNLRSKRYHLENEEESAPFVPGIVSENLRKAMGISDDELPPYIYKMRAIGYPPGHLYKCVVGNQLEEVDSGSPNSLSRMNTAEMMKKVRDNDQLIAYPGFNAPLPRGVADKSRHFGFPPINPRLFIKKKTCSSETPAGTSERGQQQRETIIRLDETPSTQSRRWWHNPLDADLFPPKRLWRAPPILSQVPTVESINCHQLQLPSTQMEELCAGEEIPTNKLEDIIKLLRRTANTI